MKYQSSTIAGDSQAIFFAANDILDRDERESFLSQACANDKSLRAKVDQLLKASSSPCDNALAKLVHQVNPQSPVDFVVDNEDHTVDLHHDPAGRHPVIDRYKLLEEIGRGGMGTVYMAQQLEPVKRRVALKVINPGMDSREVIARFEAERQALAMMEHPNIARVFDGGTTAQGYPYFVMELVRGVPITEFCRAQQLGLDERLELFTNVCHAVQHAHQKGIIHRDLKPSNVLISDHDGVPVVKIIDFGIAKAIHQELTAKTLFTQFSQMVGTPLYMSPEQAQLSGLDVDTRSDIYSLGVLLYELLTGATPFDRETLVQAGIEGARKIICEEVPPRPSVRLSTLCAAGEESTIKDVSAQESKRIVLELRDELDWIVMKALEKDRRRRYESASALAADVSRYLNDEPVEACPPSRTYRIRKFVERNRSLTAVLAVALVGLLMSASALTWGLYKAQFERNKAQLEQKRALIAAEKESKARTEAEQAQESAESYLAEANAVIDFLVDDLLGHASPDFQESEGFQAQADVTIRQALDRAAGQIDSEFGGQPRIERGCISQLGGSYGELGFVNESLEHLERAASLYRSLDGDHAAMTLSAELGRGRALTTSRRFKDAIPLLEHLVEVYQQEYPLTAENRATACNILVRCYLDAGRTDEGARLAQDTYNQLRTELGPEHPETIQAMSMLGMVSLEQFDYDRAIEIYSELYEIASHSKSTSAIQMDTWANQLGVAYCEVARFEDASQVLEEVLKRRIESLGKGHPMTLQTRQNYANALFGAGLIDDAAAILDGVTDEIAVWPSTRKQGLLLTGRIYARQQRFDRAIKTLELACQTHDGIASPITAKSIRPKYELALCLYAKGLYARAIGLLEELVEEYKRVQLSDTDLIALNAANMLAQACYKDGDTKRAIEVGENLLADFLERFPDSDPQVLVLRGNIAAYRVQAGDVKKGIAILEDVYAKSGNRKQGANLASLYVKHGFVEKARRQLRTNIAAAKSDLAPGSLDLANEIAGTTLDLLKLGEHQLAESLAREVLEIREARIPDSWKTYNSRSLLGGALLGLGQLEEAEPLLLQSYRDLARVQDSSPTYVQGERIPEAMGRIVALYKAKGDSSAAERWQRKLDELSDGESSQDTHMEDKETAAAIEGEE